MKKDEGELEKSLHKQKAEGLNIHASLIAECQRRDVLPKDLASCTASDELFLVKFAKIICNKKLLRAQMARAPREIRDELIANADYAALKRWEFCALTIFIKLYREGTKVNSEVVLAHLQGLYGVMDTRKNRQRVQQLRKLAAARVRREVNKNLPQ